MNPKVSIIIPVYNRESKVKLALESLISQTFQNFEVIIIDDGSTDRTAQVIKSYNNSKFNYIYQENAGVSTARNKGIVMSNGEYICFLDSDDYYEPTFIEKMYSKITEKGFDISYCGYFNVKSNIKVKCKSRFNDGNILLDYLLDKVKINTNCWMIRKKVITSNNIRFSENVSWGEDFEFFSEILTKTNKVCYVAEYLTNYLIDEDEDKLSSFSLDKIDKDFDFIFRLNEKINTNQNQLIKKALINYRLSALITYRLNKAFNLDFEREDIIKYFNRYKGYIVKLSFNNGLRSIKLNLTKILLIYKIMNISRTV